MTRDLPEPELLMIPAASMARPRHSRAGVIRTSLRGLLVCGVATLSFLGGIDPPYARAGQTEAVPLRFDIKKAQALADQRNPDRNDPAASLERALGAIHVDREAGKAAPREGVDLQAVARQVVSLGPALEAQLVEVRQQFEEDRQWFIEQGLQELLPRVDEAEALASERHAQAMGALRAVEYSRAKSTDLGAPLSALKVLVAGWQPASKGPMSAEEMREEMRVPVAGAPFKSDQDFLDFIADGGKSVEGLVEPKSAPTAADLLETPEVVFSEAVQAKVVELDGNPLAIYQWVRNNIKVVPGYGAAQSADFTLLNGQGTPFDIASLTIALLRSAGVPARYATGRVSMSAAQVRSWMEPVAGAADAVEVLQNAGVPAAARVVNGVVEEAQLEHVWVEAFIDYQPSRGAVHRQGDTWVPMDPSFKAHTVSQDIKPPPASHPIGARINSVWEQREQLPEGAFTRFDLDAASDELFAFGDELVADGVDAASYLPQVEIIAEQLSHFRGSLPYLVGSQSGTFSNLPDSLRYRVEIESLRGGTNQIFPVGFSSVFSRTLPMARIDGQGIHIEYAPANQTAESALNALYVQAAGELSPYALDVAPLIVIGGVVEAVLPTTRMGQNEQWRITVLDPLRMRPSKARPFEWTAGTQANVTIDAFGFTQNVLQKEAPGELAGQVVNSRTFLRAAGLSYWYGHDYYREVASAAFGGRILRQPSVGAFYKPLTVRYFFGVPRRGAYRGFTTDVLTTVGSVAPDVSVKVNMMLAMGSWGSMLEGLIWDIQTGQTPGTAATSVSVLMAANESGIPIYTIDRDNVSRILPMLRLNQESLVEIREAVTAGFIVLAPETEVSIAGQPSVAGYLIRDPVSGAGLSRIDGSLNGSIVVGCIAEAISLDNLLSFLMWQMIQRMLAPLIARGVIVAAAIFALGPIGVVAATAISVVTLICAAMTLLKFMIDLAIGGLEQALCNLIGSCAARRGGRKLLGRGRPIIPELGMKYLAEVDYEGEGPFPLRFQRSYLSGGINSKPLSVGWAAPYFSRFDESQNDQSPDGPRPNAGESYVRVELLPPGSPFVLPTLNAMIAEPHGLLFQRENVGYLQFNRSPDGYTTVGNSGDRVERIGPAEDNRWRYVGEDDVVEIYENQRLLSLTDRDGVSQTMSYNAAGQLTQVTHSLGRSLRFGYLPSGLLASMTDPAGRVTRYEYNDDLILIAVIHPDATRKTYHYEDERFPTKLTGITDERGVRTVSVEYDYQGRAIQTSGPDGVDRYRFRYSQLGYAEIDPLGTERTYRLERVEDIWRMVGSEQPCGVCGGGDSAERRFDSRGYVASETDYEGNETRTTYDARGLLRSRTEAFGTPLARTTSWEYDQSFRVMTRMVEPTSSGNRVTVQVLDDRGEVSERRVSVAGQTRTWRFTYNASGQVLTEDGPRSDVNDSIVYTYDAQGNLGSMTDALGFTTRYTRYDALGRLLEMVDPNGLVTEYQYDLRDRLIEQRVGPEGSAAREVTRFGYDAAGNITRLTLPDGSYLAYRYDDAGRLTRISDALGNRADYGYDTLGNRTSETLHDPGDTLRLTETRAYDALGRLASVQGARPEEITRFTHDGNGNELDMRSPLHARSSSTRYDALQRLASTTDATGAEIRYVYDAQDNLREVIDPRTLSTRYTFNGFDELTRLASPDTGIADYQFDPAGNLASQSDARGISASFSYDAANRLRQVSYPDELLAFAYDDDSQGGEGARGRLVTASTTAQGASGIADTELGFVYDRYGRVIARQQSVGDRTPLSTSYEYDPTGRIERSQLPSGVEIRYGYGSDGRLLRILVNGVEIVSEIEYFPLGEPKSWRYGPGTARYEREFDQDGRIREHSLGAASRELEYDLNGRISAIVDTGAARSDWSFDYDDADRLTAADNAANSGATAGSAFDWLYDATGNRTRQIKQTGSAGAETLDYEIAGTSNRLSQRSGSISDARQYDAAGNTTRWRSDAGQFAGSTLTAEYGGRNRLQNVDRIDTGGNARIARYAYNAFGERVAKWTGASAAVPGSAPSEQFVYDEDGHLLGRYDGSGGLILEQLWLGDTPIAVILPATAPQAGQAIPANGNAPAVQALFVHPDHLDTPRLLVNAADLPVWRWESAPFGDTPAETNPSGLGELNYTLRFPGQQFDSETALHYNYFRDYEAGVGRYVQSDPIGLGGGVAQFGYAGADPLSWTDPFGHAPTRKSRDAVIAENCKFFGGQNRCEKCLGNTVRPAKSTKDVSPPQNEWQIDHVDAVSNGGGDELENLQLLCRKCNRDESNDPNKRNHREKNRRGWRRFMPWNWR